MTINGYEVDIDFTDADVIERIDKGCEKLYQEAEELKKLQKEDENFNTAEGIRQECKIIKDFFDYVLGEGTSEQIFKGKNSLNLCLKAYDDIVEMKEKQFKELNDRISDYSPDRLKR